MNTTMLIKLDKKIKEKAQRAAKDLGLPMSTIISNYLKEFGEKREVTFSAPELNAKTRKLLDQRIKEIREGKTVGPFNTVEAFMKELNS